MCRYYPGVEISDDISTEAERVKFLQSVAQVMLTKARMKMNIKRLYAADGNAVKELLKLASLLYKATSKAGDVDDVSLARLCSCRRGRPPHAAPRLVCRASATPSSLQR
jgi:hypothetical protein